MRNPQLPPTRVFCGQRSKDEMGDLWFQLAMHPEYGLAHTNLGRILLTQGKTADALIHLPGGGAPR